jgi:pilus assembly protein Flp/PilA
MLLRGGTDVLFLYLYVFNSLNSEEGQDLAEYGLLLGLIAVIVMVAVAALGNSLLGLFDRLAAAVSAWSGGGTG